MSKEVRMVQLSINGGGKKSSTDGGFTLSASKKSAILNEKWMKGS
ncbi:hypothetical protein AB3U99_14305 [Niallia sp. JL1B1071]